MIAKKEHKHVTVEMVDGKQKINYLDTENPFNFKKGYQYILQHDKIVFSSPDKYSIPMLWNNISGKNFEGKDILGQEQTKSDHLKYIEMMKLTAGLPAGYIQLYLKPGKMAEEFYVPESTNIEGVKKGLTNAGRPLFFKEAVKFTDIFVEDKNGKHGYDLPGKFNLTPAAIKAAQDWHCVQWGNTYHFNIHHIENGFTIINIKADQIIASATFAVIETSSIPKAKEEEEIVEEKSIQTDSKKLTAKEVFALCSITDDHIVKLPNMILHPKTYNDVKSIIEKNGGRWKGGKTQGFQFEFNPTDLFQKLHSGEDVNNKKEFQFFATPVEVVDLMISKANLKPTDILLEPSAGQGAIVDKVISLVKKVDMCELMPENRQILQNKGYEIQWGDFLDVNEDLKYDKIIANPPFTKNQDIDHVLKMYKHLNPGGRIVTIMSTTWLEGSQKKQGAFKEWLTEVGASYEVIKEGAFKKSGTGIKTVMVVIDKK